MIIVTLILSGAYRKGETAFLGVPEGGNYVQMDQYNVQENPVLELFELVGLKSQQNQPKSNLFDYYQIVTKISPLEPLSKCEQTEYHKISCSIS